MTEQEARKFLEDLQNWIRSKDILYQETKFNDPNGSQYGFVGYHIRKIRKESGEAWDSERAVQYLTALKIPIDDKYGG